ncbi:MAG TPA: stage II sporulation protein M, partial [Thermoanaerobaculia bacterium]|nr:stage II sporulation protein M [Thermoanaerobaculia bacterium]
MSGSSPGFTLKSAQFRRERERSWRELEELVERVEHHGLASLSAAEISLLPALYRSAVSSLSVAAAISLDRNLLDYLNALVGRAYLCVYGVKQPVRQALAELFTARFPRAVRRYLPFVAAAVLLMALGTLAGYRLTRADPERFYSFVGDDLAQGRTPASSTAELRAVLYKGPEGDSSMLGAFAAVLFTHNAKIGILCFALGFAAGAPVIFLLFENGLTLGAMA